MTIKERNIIITVLGEGELFTMKQGPVEEERWNMGQREGGTFSVGHVVEGTSMDLVGDAVLPTLTVAMDLVVGVK